MKREEERYRRNNRKPYQNNVDERQVGAVQAKEERRPRRVEHQLKGVNGKRQNGTGEPEFPPNQPA